MTLREGVPDRWFLCLDDFPWEQDGWRELAGGEAHAFQLRQQPDLDAGGIAYIALDGPLERRVWTRSPMP